MKNKLILTALSTVLIGNCVFAADYVKNDLKTMFLNNESIIYEINMRSFNADDKNGDGIIEVEKGETIGNFLNAIDRLDELQDIGINAIHLMPVNPVGKKQSLGTAGSLYAMNDIAGIDSAIVDCNSKLTDKEQAKKFIEECHKRGIRVFVDLPACGSYEMTELRPELFAKDEKGNFIIPVTWSDVRLFKTVEADGSINKKLLDEHKKYVDMLLEIGADGIRADVAPIKPQKFWSELISYARQKDEEFMFLAETAEAWAPPKIPFPTANYKQLLEAGFDGYYGNCLDFLNFKSSKDFEKVFAHINKLASKGIKKSIIGCFDTHDLKSAYLTSDNYAESIMYMNATLPLNPYYVDGFPTGDKYDYPYAGKKAEKTYTDSNIYFTHKGQIDIFNYSRRPGGQNIKAKEMLKKTIELRKELGDIVTKGSFEMVKTSSPKIFAYERQYNNEGIIVAVNSDQKWPVVFTINVKSKCKTADYDVLTDGKKVTLSKDNFVINLSAGKTAVIRYRIDKN